MRFSREYAQLSAENGMLVYTSSYDQGPGGGAQAHNPQL